MGGALGTGGKPVVGDGGVGFEHSGQSVDDGLGLFATQGIENGLGIAAGLDQAVMTKTGQVLRQGGLAESDQGFQVSHAFLATSQMTKHEKSVGVAHSLEQDACLLVVLFNGKARHFGSYFRVVIDDHASLEGQGGRVGMLRMCISEIFVGLNRTKGQGTPYFRTYRHMDFQTGQARGSALFRSLPGVFSGGAATAGGAPVTFTDPDNKSQ